MIKIMFCIIFQNVINQKKELKIELLLIYKRDRFWKPVLIKAELRN